MDLGKRLRADVPALEPDPVLLAQLVQLSTTAAQPAASRRAHGARAMLVAAGAAGIVSGTAWLAGALPGTASPWHPAHHDRPTPTQHMSRPVPRHASTPTAPGAAGSADVPEDRYASESPTRSASHEARPSHPSHPTRPSRSAHPTHSIHPSHPVHPTHHPHHQDQGHIPHPAPR